MQPVKHATLQLLLLSLAMDNYFPARMLQIDLVGKLTEKASFTTILTAEDVFWKYVFAVALRNAGASNVGKQLFQIFMRTSYVTTTILSDMGTAFTARLMKELCQILEIDIECASVKHQHTIGSLERTHASLKQYHGIYENHIKLHWHNYVDSAVFVHKTSYASSIGYTPTFVFQGRYPIIPLDLRLNNEVMQKLETRYEVTRYSPDRIKEVFSLARDATISAYNKYRHFYDRKTLASLLKKTPFLPTPESVTIECVKDNMGKLLNKWLPFYRNEQVTTNSNYSIRKVGTLFTQCVHRIRLRPITRQYSVEDLPSLIPQNFQPDPITRHCPELAVFDQALPDLFTDTTFSSR